MLSSTLVHVRDIIQPMCQQAANISEGERYTERAEMQSSSSCSLPKVLSSVLVAIGNDVGPLASQALLIELSSECLLSCEASLGCLLLASRLPLGIDLQT